MTFIIAIKPLDIASHVGIIRAGRDIMRRVEVPVSVVVLMFVQRKS